MTVTLPVTVTLPLPLLLPLPLPLPLPLTLALPLLPNPGSSPGHLCREFSTCRQIASRFPELDLATSREVNYEVYTYKKGSYHTTSRVLDECRTFVLHFGQWDLGYPRGYPTALGDFEERLRGSIARILAHNPRSPVYLLPTNFVPLNCLTTTCPAHDWRTPPMVVAYHTIVQRTCLALGIGCIDTVDLQGPLWDASVDWNHPVPVALAAMARRIALRVTQGFTSGNTEEDGRAQSHRSTRVGVEGTRIGRSKAV